MGKLKVSFRCHHCGHCCTEVICFPTPGDVVRIVRATRIDPLDFLEFIGPDDIADVPKSDPTWLDVDGQRFLMALRRGKGGCFFRDPARKHCVVYEHRPLLCRLFPFKLHETKQGEYKAFSLHKDIECPRRRDGETPTAPLYELWKEDCEHQLDYNDLVAVFNRQQYPGKKPEDFVEMFVQVNRKPPRKAAGRKRGN